MAHDVFISYANGDRARAAELASALETKGWSIWWDRDIPPGRAFDEVIEEALTHTRSVVVLWSAESVKSRWVRTEASAAAERGTLVPALIEPVTIPLEFRRLEAADLTSWHGEQTHHELQALMATLAGLIKTDTSMGSTARTMPAVARGSAVVRERPVRSVGVWLSILAAFIAGGGVVYFLTAGDGTSGSTSPEETSASAPGVTSGPSAGTGTEGAGSAVSGASQPGMSPTPAPVAPVKGRVNLLSTANGGHLMMAPNDAWRYPIDDDPTGFQYLPTANGDAVYAFRNEQAATFDTFMMLIAETARTNIKEFELLAGNDAPLGAFDSIGRFQTQNIRLYPTPWQEFKFKPVRARFFKLRVISAWDAGANGMPTVTEWQLLGSF